LKNVYFLAIPVIIGLIIGFIFISNEDNSDQKSNLLNKEKLLENTPPIIGDVDAKITILEFGDYQCTFCYKFHQQTLEKIKESYIDTGKVNYTYKDFPLNGLDSILAAEASFCANEQGKYWEYHDTIFNNWAGERTGWITSNSLLDFAEQNKLNVNEFTECVNNHKYTQKVIENQKFAENIGINATPSFLIFNDEKLVRVIGAQPIEKFVDAIQQIN
jgi:protein-disulfide isomerase|tara:strand:+ start:56 stop:706 length:651 start_codon:yes stop_codon:yes gene_type:complete